MLFNSDIFLFAFLPTVFTLFWLARSKQQRYIILTVASYIFYGYWNWRFCLLLLFSSLFSFFMALLIQRATKRSAALRFMILSIAVDLAILGIFKYYNFFADTLNHVSSTTLLPFLNVVLPIGISFYTFHTISYIVDVTTGRVKATSNILEYLTYVGLFAQLVAGPIVRFRQIEDDLEHIDGTPKLDFMARGLGFFVVGLIKKVIVADTIAGYIDPMIASYQTMSTASAWLAALGFTFQLYYDFSGYSDMAVGLGYLFGLRIPQNFNAPYRASNIADFWRRWHMSLSSWLRDYLYIPLGGNRHGISRTYFNLMVTMLLGGLWHGANWTFVIWGAYHGLLLCLERLGGRWIQRVPAHLARWSTFLLVVIGWVLFRSDNLDVAGTWLSTMFGFTSSTADVPVALLWWIIAGLVAVNIVPETWDIRFGVRPRWGVVYALGFFIAYFFMNNKQTVFLYYQF
jgi:alginate O-acetyltransferase complex protein AlgI